MRSPQTFAPSSSSRTQPSAAPFVVEPALNGGHDVVWLPGWSFAEATQAAMSTQSPTTGSSVFVGCRISSRSICCCKDASLGTVSQTIRHVAIRVSNKSFHPIRSSPPKNLHRGGVARRMMPRRRRFAASARRSVLSRLSTSRSGDVEPLLLRNNASGPLSSSEWRTYSTHALRRCLTCARCEATR